MTKKEYGNLIALLFVVLSISLISANGLTINNNNLILNKTSGVNSYFVINITNNDAFAFYNISFESNNYITNTKLASISPSETKLINVTLISDNSVTTSVRLKGFFYSTVGQQNRQHNVSITSFESNPCDISVIKGDTVVFTNNINNQVIMKKYEDASPLAVLNVNQTYTYNSITPGTFNYYLSIGGFNFPQTCHITVLDDNGLVNDPQLDGILTFTVTSTYPATTLTSSSLVKNYTTDFNVQQEGVMTISNTGPNIAKNIKLEGDWFSFNYNNFDLSPGQSKGIIYTITPIIFNSSDTGKAHNKSFSITGNFPSLKESFNIYINSANVNTNASGQDLIYLRDVFCPKFPHSSLCDPEPQIVYKYIGNGSGSSVEFNITEEQWRNLWLTFFSFQDDVKTVANNIKLTNDDVGTKFNMINATISNLDTQMAQESLNRQNSTDGVTIFIIILTIILIITILGALIYLYNRRMKINKGNKF